MLTCGSWRLALNAHGYLRFTEDVEGAAA
jgi:hypothetical protein